MGPEGHGYVRTMGSGPTPSHVFGKASISQTPIDESILSLKLESLVKEKMESMVSTMQSEIDNLKNRLEEMVVDASSSPNLNTNLNGYNVSHEAHGTAEDVLCSLSSNSNVNGAACMDSLTDFLRLV
ncbi:hypothetical protein M9H77_07618 [Catharanthus roseus]|uniref:Uncharacterized protein n=1 Tax=Catharanthus roseus TaxID=4058 RepID=A0ACC0BVQ6_CATRO|nr:hypothetical protein M9H77_07618 [Catharanthus roseus]